MVIPIWENSENREKGRKEGEKRKKKGGGGREGYTIYA